MRLCQRSLNLRALISVCLVELTACGGAVPWPEYNAKMAGVVRKRAAFELNCQEQQLKLTPLAHGSRTEPEFVSEYGVEGCDQRAIYVHVPDTQDWVNNTGGKAAVEKK